MLINKELLERIEEKKERLDNLRPLSKKAVEKLRERLNIELTYNSNAIEGNRLTLRETQLVLQQGITVSGKPLKHHLEAINHEKALEWVEEIASKKKKINEETILLIHEMIMNRITEEAGKWRITRVRITGAKFTPPSPEKILKLITNFINWINSNESIHPIEKAALAHYQLVHIHPFIDGNGRTGRLVMNLMLMQNGYPITILLKVDRQKYYRALDEANKENYGPIVNFIGRAVDRSLSLYLEALEPVKSEKQAKETEFISLAEATKYCDYSQEYLSLLARRGNLDAIKIGRNWHTTKRAIDKYLEKVKG